ncbi:MAG: hypothetical protein IJQ86_06355 [Spirochaetia bacterium]|nr:hypothetical protein [Spirochaetia bacterium]
MGEDISTYRKPFCGCLLWLRRLLRQSWDLPDNIAALKELARKAGKPVSRYVLDLTPGE